VRWSALWKRRKYRYGLLGLTGMALLAFAVVSLPTAVASALMAAIVLICGLISVTWYVRQPVLELVHAPSLVTRRHGALSANICGVAHYLARICYRLNDGPELPVPQAPERSPKPCFTIELEPGTLRAGRNTLVVESWVPARRTIRKTTTFQYDPAPIQLPLMQDWSNAILESQDGCWEVVQTPIGGRVRPCPGKENYDRILLVTGAFSVPRRVETDMVYQGRGASRHSQFGFGVLSLWGGHPDEPQYRPRRGWRYGAAWFFSSYGVNAEFSIKEGAERRWDATMSVNSRVEPGGRYRLVVECWTVSDPQGKHPRHRQRMKWWIWGQNEPDEWIECSEGGRARLPQGDYAVALLAHQCQVDFGPVHVSLLPAREALSNDNP